MRFLRLLFIGFGLSVLTTNLKTKLQMKVDSTVLHRECAHIANGNLRLNSELKFVRTLNLRGGLKNAETASETAQNVTRNRKLVTKVMEPHSAGAEYGLFFDIEAKNTSVEIIAIKTAAHGISNPEAHARPIEGQPVQPRLDIPSLPMNITVYICQGSRCDN